MKKSIKSLTIPELLAYAKNHNQPKFRVDQILEWLYFHQVDNFESMTNLPKTFIECLTRDFVIESLTTEDIKESSDGTCKFVLQSNCSIENSCEPIFFEAVGIPSLNKSSNKLTVCISSQAGCPMSCMFCATGKQGFCRNLTTGEIVDQIIFASKHFNQKVTNVVVMGQGEPFLNFQNLVSALEIINNPKCLNIGARKITVSTSGIINGIESFSKLNKQFGLAVSLHSAIQEKRNYLMPGVKNFSLNKLKKALINYIDKTNRRVTFEYLMLHGINDQTEDLNALINFCNGLLCHINLIKYNNVPNSEFSSSNNETINAWLEKLNAEGIETTLRASRGNDIDAACGQLLNKLNKNVSRET